MSIAAQPTSAGLGVVFLFDLPDDRPEHVSRVIEAWGELFSCLSEEELARSLDIFTEVFTGGGHEDEG